MNDDTPEVSAPDTSFVQQLDARQRAMLAEMGVRVWAPKPQASLQPAEASALAHSEPPRAEEPTRAAKVQNPAPARQAVASVPQPVTAFIPAESSPSLQALPDGLGSMDWAALQAAVVACQSCGLCQRRKNAVVGQGDQQADWMVVGDAPTEAEDAQGDPFVGLEGELLDNMLRAVGQSREKGAYVTSVVKCRPPSSRNPSAEELAQCSGYLARQVALVQPKVILAMGRFAQSVLTQSNEHLGRLRGREHVFEGVPVIATYHPNALLRTAADKAKAWADLCLAMDVVARG